MAPPPDPRLDWRVEYVPLFEMTCVSRVSDPPCGFRLPAISERPSPAPRATAGTPTARMSVLMRIAFMHPATTRGERSCARVSRVTCKGLPLARELDRVDRDRLGEVERGADDAGLLDRVGGRVALARRRALRPADVTELERRGQDVQQARGHVGARTHVPRLLLRPHDLAQVRVPRHLVEDLLLWERVQQFDA